MRPTHYFSVLNRHPRNHRGFLPCNRIAGLCELHHIVRQPVDPGVCFPMLPLARKGRLTLSLSTSEATDPLWGQLSVENWALLRHRCGWFRHVTSTRCNRRYARRWSTEHVCPIEIEDDFLLCHELGSQAIRIWFCVFRMY